MILLVQYNDTQPLEMVSGEDKMNKKIDWFINNMKTTRVEIKKEFNIVNKYFIGGWFTTFNDKTVYDKYKKSLEK